eukprot:1158446-Pelagomonas_calceolata.AAC.1
MLLCHLSVSSVVDYLDPELTLIHVVFNEQGVQVLEEQASRTLCNWVTAPRPLNTGYCKS